MKQVVCTNKSGWRGVSGGGAGYKHSGPKFNEIVTVTQSDCYEDAWHVSEYPFDCFGGTAHYDKKYFADIPTTEELIRAIEEPIEQTV